MPSLHPQRADGTWPVMRHACGQRAASRRRIRCANNTIRRLQGTLTHGTLLWAASSLRSGASPDGDETIVLSAVNLQRRLIHGTSAEFDSDDIQPGHDGLIHLSEKEIGEFKRDYRHEYDSDIDTDDMPVLPDQRDWNPVNVGEAMVTAGLMSGKEVEAAKREAGITDEKAVQEFDQETLRGELAGALDQDLMTDDGHIRGLDELLQDAGDMAYDAEEYGGDFAYTTDELDAIDKQRSDYDAMRESLYKAARQKGIKAFKYRNAFERDTKAGSYSVGVVDPDILKPVERKERIPEEELHRAICDSGELLQGRRPCQSCTSQRNKSPERPASS